MTDSEFCRLLKQKVKANDSQFQYWVGWCYFVGEGGIEKNSAEAIKWYTLAAQQGHAAAQNDLGALYHYGEGVAQDDQKAVEYHMLSRKQGHWMASQNLGFLYRYGIGVPKDIAKAKAYYEEALARKDYEYEPADAEEIEGIQAVLAEINAVLEAEKTVTETEKAKRTGVFISYAHKDSEFIDAMRPHMVMLETISGVPYWDDTKIKPSEKWDERIKEELSKAKVIVFLVSANLFASEYVRNVEFPRAMIAAESEGAEILWIPVRTCDADSVPTITRYQAVTDKSRPLARRSADECDEVFTNLAKRIKEILGTEPLTTGPPEQSGGP
jgi:hypothetical protein